jgi:hypothetical protein
MPRNRRRQRNDVIDIDCVDVSDGTPATGHVTRYDPHQDQTPSAKALMLAIGQGLARYVSLEMRDQRDHDRALARVERRGELARVQKDIDAELQERDITNATNGVIAHIHAEKEVTQEQIRAQNDVLLTEYQETKALESQKKEVDARQIQVDVLKMKRQLEEIDDMGLSPLDAEYAKEKVRRAWRTTNGQSDHHSQRQSARAESA